ncbi:MAG: dihydrodipicolinate synthase family protein [Bryobacteraceae bacterium]
MSPEIKMTSLPRPLRGVYPPMITPLLAPDRLDVAGLERLIEHILGGGCNGLFILGTTGEGPALSYRVRREVIDRSCRQVAGRIPVLVGITDTAFGESVDLAEYACKAGAQAAAVAPPYYFDASQAELLGYYERLAAALPFPMYLYNAPLYTGHSLAVKTVRDAANIPGVLGIKDSSSNMIYFHSLVHAFRDRPDFTLLVGPEELMAEAVLLGGHGGMCGGSNICPQLYTSLYAAAARRDLTEVNRLQERVMHISTTIYHVTNDPSAYVAGMKCAVSLLGICSDTLAEPFRAFDAAQRKQVRRHLEAAELLPHGAVQA